MSPRYPDVTWIPWCHSDKGGVQRYACWYQSRGKHALGIVPQPCIAGIIDMVSNSTGFSICWFIKLCRTAIAPCLLLMSPRYPDVTRTPWCHSDALMSLGGRSAEICMLIPEAREARIRDSAPILYLQYQCHGQQLNMLCCGTFISNPAK